MVKRVLVGVIFVPLIIALILFAPAWAFACFAALITSFASWELLHAVAKLPARLYVYTSLAAAILPFGFLAGRYAGVLTLGFTALALFVILFVEAIFAYDQKQGEGHSLRGCDEKPVCGHPHAGVPVLTGDPAGVRPSPCALYHRPDLYHRCGRLLRGGALRPSQRDHAGQSATNRWRAISAAL